jgi:GT2 family glycosyltransferase
MLQITSDWEQELIESFADETVAIVGALLLYPDERIQHAGVYSNDSGVYHAYHHGLTSDSSFRSLPEKYEVEAVTGAFMAVRKSVWDEIGGMNEAFPINFGDFEFCLMVRERGYRVIQNNRIIFRHFESASRKRGINPVESHLLANLQSNYRGMSNCFLPVQPSTSQVYDFASLITYVRAYGLIKTLQGILRRLRRLGL